MSVRHGVGEELRVWMRYGVDVRLYRLGSGSRFADFVLKLEA